MFNLKFLYLLSVFTLLCFSKVFAMDPNYLQFGFAGQLYIRRQTFFGQAVINYHHNISLCTYKGSTITCEFKESNLKNFYIEIPLLSKSNKFIKSDDIYAWEVFHYNKLGDEFCNKEIAATPFGNTIKEVVNSPIYYTNSENYTNQIEFYSRNKRTIILYYNKVYVKKH